MQNPPHIHSRFSPTGLFIIVLAAIATVEIGGMFALHRLLPEGSTPFWARIAAETIALMLICLPIWRFFLRPLRLAAESESLQAHAIMDTAADGIVAIDEHGTVSAFNRAAEHIFGYSSADIIGRNVAMLMPAPQRHQHDEYLRRYRQSGQGKVVGQRTKLQGMRQDGTLFPLELAVSEIRIHGKRVFTAIVRDLTAQKQAEVDILRAQEELRAKERYESALLDATAESALLLESDGTVLTINQTCAERFGQTREAMLGQPVWDFMPPDLAARRQAQFAAILATGRPSSYEDSRNGRRYRIAVHPVQEAGQQLRRLAVFATDITEQRLLRGADELLHAMDRNLLGAIPLPEVLRQACQQIAELFELRLAWIGKKLPDGCVSVCAGAGPAQHYLDELLKQGGVRWDDSAQGHGPVGSAIRSGAPCLQGSAVSSFQPWRAIAEQAGIQYIRAFPLLLRGEVYGALTVYAEREDVLRDPLATRVLESIVARLDVTLEHWLDQQRLRLLRSALSTAGNSILITDRDGRIEWVNQAFSRLTGYSAQEAIGQTPRLLKSGKQNAAYYQQLWATILAGDVWSHETEERHKDGSLYIVQQTITPIRGDNDEITHFISIQEDISAQKIAEQRIQHMAHYDALTGLPNRSLFFDRLGHALANSKRSAEHVALLFLDLDRFKPVNDTYGHVVGDALLKAVAERLINCVRESDTVARIAGDEFTVILSRLNHRADATVVAEKIVKAISEPFLLGGHTVHIGTSIGIALYPDDAPDEQELLRLADEAMYEAKHHGRNTYRFHTPA
jgi:diguanylate cyclase (GGDEF)-like protein/PAS domain S-box-containing protein